MKNTLILLTIIATLISCGKDSNPSGIVQINGTIDGLKVGKVLLQKIEDTTLITLDSVQLDGDSKFSLSTPLDEPQLMYIYLDIKDGAKYDDRIAFFAEDTVLNFTSSLEKFEDDALISGSKNNDILAEFNKNRKRLNDVYTDLAKRSMVLSAQENPDVMEVEQLNVDYDKYLRKKVLYAINYANRFNDKEVAPYLLITEAFDANPILLDSSFQKMTKKIQTSRYGKQLSELIKESKKVNL